MLKGTGISDGIGLGKAIIFESQKIKLEKNKNLTPDGIPRFGIMVAIRDYE